jgi:hypothetical protein
LQQGFKKSSEKFAGGAGNIEILQLHDRRVLAPLFRNIEWLRRAFVNRASR